MKYNLHINQYAWAQLGFKLDLIHMAMFDFIYAFINTDKCMKFQDGGYTWFWISYQLIIEGMPILGLKKDTLKKRLRDIVDAELLEAHPNNKELGRTYLKLGKKAGGYFFSGGVKDSHPWGDIPLPPRDLNPQYNTIKDNTSKRKEFIETRDWRTEEPSGVIAASAGFRFLNYTEYYTWLCSDDNDIAPKPPKGKSPFDV